MLQDSDIVERCLSGVNALASYHFRERMGGRGGLDSQIMESEGSHGKVQESVSSHFLKLILQLLLFEDFRWDLHTDNSILSSLEFMLKVNFVCHTLYKSLVFIVVYFWVLEVLLQNGISRFCCRCFAPFTSLRTGVVSGLLSSLSVTWTFASQLCPFSADDRIIIYNRIRGFMMNLFFLPNIFPA